MSELKKKIKAVMMDHLRTKGHPNLSNEEILNELKPMWIKLEEAQLIQAGWNFTQFTRIAQGIYQRELMGRAMEEELSRLYRNKPR